MGAWVRRPLREHEGRVGAIDVHPRGAKAPADPDPDARGGGFRGAYRHRDPTPPEHPRGPPGEFLEAGVGPERDGGFGLCRDTANGRRRQERD